MLVCNYCGRNFKKEYETCPGCGASSFKRISMIDQYSINTPPKDGYHIKVDSYEKSIDLAKKVKWGGIAAIIFMIILDIPFVLMGVSSLNSNTNFGSTFLFSSLGISSIFYAIGIGIIIFSYKMKGKALENIKRVKTLARTGVVVKNMPYELKEANIEINGIPVYCIEVQYETKSGNTIPLRSDPKYSGAFGDEDGTADLLIDPYDFSNYYIDFEIY